MKLIKYEDKYHDITIEWIADFFEFHKNLVKADKLTDEEIQNAKESLEYWITGEHELYMIDSEDEHSKNNCIVGFVHIWYKGDIVAWIEDVYISPDNRNKGYASESIRKAEEIVKQREGYIAVSMDVSPRNFVAMKLYHKLGYDTISLVTVRKDFYENVRDKHEKFMGLDYRV